MRVHRSTSNIIERAVTRVAAMALAFAMLGGTALAAPAVGRDHIDTKDLAGAALSPIDITLQAFTCDTAGLRPHRNDEGRARQRDVQRRWCRQHVQSQ